MFCIFLRACCEVRGRAVRLRVCVFTRAVVCVRGWNGWYAFRARSDLVDLVSVFFVRFGCRGMLMRAVGVYFCVYVQCVFGLSRMNADDSPLDAISSSEYTAYCVCARAACSRGLWRT